MEALGPLGNPGAERFGQRLRDSHWGLPLHNRICPGGDDSFHLLDVGRKQLGVEPIGVTVKSADSTDS